MCQTFNQPMIEKWILYFSNHSYLNDKYRFLVLENFICYLMNRNGILPFFIILMEFFFLEHLSYFLSIFIASLDLHINLNNKIVFCCCYFYVWQGNNVIFIEHFCYIVLFFRRFSTFLHFDLYPICWYLISIFIFTFFSTVFFFLHWQHDYYFFAFFSFLCLFHFYK